MKYNVEFHYQKVSLELDTKHLGIILSELNLVYLIKKKNTIVIYARSNSHLTN